MSGEKKIVFYDIPGKTESTKAWSINMWKTRYVLNYKQIPYATKWIEYPDIAPHFKSIGMPSSGKNPRTGGEDAYTCPSVEIPGDGDKPLLLTDSFKITEYLDKHYPDHPLFPYSTKGLQLLFTDQISPNMLSPLYPLILQLSFENLTPGSADYFRTTREAVFGKKIEEFCPPGPEREAAIQKAKEGFHKMAPYLTEKAGNKDGIFLLGSDITYADLHLGASLKWLKAVGEDAIWSHIKEWDDGLWDRFLTTLDAKYGQVL